MLRIVRSENADQQLEGIWEYIAFANPTSGNPSSADVVLDAIRNTFTTLAEFPHRRKIHEKGIYLAPVEGYSRYIVLYQFDDETLEVLHVLRADLDWMRLL